MNSDIDKSKAVKTFDGNEKLAKRRHLPKQYTELIKTHFGELFFLSSVYIDGVLGDYADRIDSSLKRRIIPEEIMDELNKMYCIKDSILAETFKKL